MPEVVSDPTPSGQMPLVTTEVPRPAISGGQIAQSYEALGRGEQEFSQGLEKGLATPLAEAQAARDLQDEKVTIGPDGKMQVSNIPRSLIFGPAGEQFAQTVQAGTVARSDALINQKLTEIHQQHLGDPQGQATANESFIAGLKGTTGIPSIDAAIQQHALDGASRHYDDNVTYTGKVTLNNSYRDLNATKESAAEDLETLAKAGKGPGDPEWDQKQKQWNDAQAALQANPLLKTPDALADLERSQHEERLQSARGLAGMEAEFNRGGMPALQKMADAIRMDEKLSRADRTRLYEDVRAYMRDRQPEYAANVAVSQGTVDGILKNHVATSDPAVYDALAKARAAGDVKGAQALMAYLYTNVAVEQWNRMSDADKKTYTDEATREGLPTEIPTAPREGQPPKPGAEPTGDIPPPLEGGATGAAAVTTPPKAEWPTGAVTVTRTASGYPVYVDKDGKALPDEKQPKETVAAGGATVQPASLSAAGVMDAYRARTAQIESQNGADPNAHGNIYQFMGATAAKYGYHPGMSRADQDAMMDRLTADNMQALRNGLGRDPTPAELYLAHQQGAQGALHLLADPSRRAADIVGVIAITGNGGTADMSAGDFVRMWEAKYNRTPATAATGGATTASGGYRPTPAESSANPFLLNRYIASTAQDTESQWKFVEATAESIRVANQYGTPSDPASVGMVVKFAQENPDNAKAQNIAMEIGGGAMAASAQSMPATQHGEWVNQMNAAAASPVSSQLQKLLATEALKQDAHLQDLWNKDRYGMAARSGWIDRMPVPLDLSSPQGMGQAARAIAERGQAANIISNRKGGAEVGALEPDALANVKAALDGPDANAKALVLQGLSQLDGQARDATMRELRSQPGLVVAMKLVGQGPEGAAAAQSVLQGEQLLAQEPRYAPKENETGGIEDTLVKNLPSSDFRSPDERAAIGHAARAVYATLSAAANDTSERMNSDRFTKALDTVTGGVVDFRGAKVFAPKYGKTEDDLDRTVKALTDADFGNARAPDGSHVPASILNQGGGGNFMGRWLLGPGWQLESRELGSGKYYVRSGDSYLTDASNPGQKFTLDLGAKVDQAPPPGRVQYPWQ